MNTNSAQDAQGKTALPDDVEAFLVKAEQAVNQGWHVGNDDARILIAIVREQHTDREDIRDALGLDADADVAYGAALIRLELDNAKTRLARAESAELALLDLRRATRSDFEPSNELGAKLLVQSVVEKLDRLAKLEAAARSVRDTRAFYWTNEHAIRIDELIVLVNEGEKGGKS